MDEKKVVAAAVRFVRAAKHTRWTDLRRHSVERSVSQAERLTVANDYYLSALTSDYYRSLADLTTAEQDLILAVDGEDDEP